MSGRNTSWFKYLALVLGLTLFGSMLVACGTPSTPAAPTRAAAIGATPIPKSEGVLRLGLSNLSRELLDPYQDSGLGNAVISLVYDVLVGTTRDGMDLGPIGGLATRWEQKSDSSGWTFYLRKGVQWDRGYGEVTAEDVKFSLDRLVFRDGGNVTDRPTLKAGIKSIVVVDPYTLTIETNNAFLDLPTMLSILHGVNGAIVPKKAIEQMGEQTWVRNPVTSGPYRLVEHSSGAYFKFEAREDYWGGVPRYKEIYVHNVPEDATRVAMLKRGELDIAEVAISQLKELEAASFQLVEKKDSMELMAFIHNQWEGVLAKKEVRQALNLAVNRRELADRLFEGRARPMSGDNPSFLLGGKDLPVIPYDPEQAKRLLTQAGYPSGFDLAIIARPQIPLPLLAEALSGYYRSVGINATVKPMDSATSTSLWREGKLKDTMVPFNGSNRKFNVAGYTTRFSAKGSVTLVRDSDPALEQLLQTAAKSRTLDEMALNQGNIQQYVHDEAREMGLLHVGQWFAASPKVRTTGWNGGGQQVFGLGWWQLIAQ